ncbi:hypothetical protein [Nocardioides nanhaiensis]|uniref:DUF559 domain-containing protein n=1 Tax=Nocardioides nanhaiensis TaxID=1476871 RepID=A0ABP8VWE3_9ACTN
MREIPEALLEGPFSHEQARALGVTARMLQGRRFVRIFPRVHCLRDAELSLEQWVRAAVMTLPADARVTGVTRLQLAGLPHGPLRPLHFVVARDHHVTPSGIFLHRTEAMPPCDGVGVTVAAAFVELCRWARTIDAISTGDWLLRNRLMAVQEVRELCLAQLWRAGSDEALWVLPYLVATSRSRPESELRAMMEFAELARPEPNPLLQLSDEDVVMGDLVLNEPRVVIEYEGTHHQTDRRQYCSDIDRYALLRRHQLPYIQVTKERAARPQRMITWLHEQLLELGYRGPSPRFDRRWPLLFLPLAVAVGERSYGQRRR